MDWNTVQQLIRIIMNALGAYLVATGFPEDIVTSLIGAVMSGASVVWWWVWNKTFAPAPVVVEEVTKIDDAA